MSERDMQASIVAECNLRANQNPLYGLLFAIPNGQYRKGQRAEPGMKAGVPDLFLPVARGGFHGLFIELKVSPNKRERIQSLWQIRLSEQGYECHTVWDDGDEVMRIITEYIEGAKP